MMIMIQKGSWGSDSGKIELSPAPAANVQLESELLCVSD
jgi:hypothetical protein